MDDPRDASKDRKTDASESAVVDTAVDKSKPPATIDHKTAREISESDDLPA